MYWHSPRPCFSTSLHPRRARFGWVSMKAIMMNVETRKHDLRLNPARASVRPSALTPALDSSNEGCNSRYTVQYPKNSLHPSIHQALHFPHTHLSYEIFLRRHKKLRHCRSQLCQSVKGAGETTESTELYSLGRIFLIRATTESGQAQPPTQIFKNVPVVLLT